MDLFVVDAFVRPDPVYTTNRAEDAPASVSFSDILQERIAAPAATEARADAPARQANAAAPAEKPEREIAPAAETQPRSSEKPAKADASTDSDVAEHAEVADDAGNAEDAAPAEEAAAVEGEVSDAATTAAAKPAVLLPLLPIPAAANMPVVAAVAETPVVMNTDGAVPAEIVDAPAGAPKPATPVAAAPTSDIPAAPKATAPATPFMPELQAEAPLQAASPDAAKPATDASKQIAATLPLVDDAAVSQPAVSQTIVQSAAVQAAETVIAPAAKQADKSGATTAVDSAASLAADLGADAAGDVITVSVDDAPVADKAVQPRLAPTAGVVARSPETAATPVLTPTSNGFAVQIAAQDPSAQPSEVAPANLNTPEAKGPAVASKPEIATPAFELPVDSGTPTTQSNTANPLFAAEQANVRAANAASETSAANHATRSTAHPVVEQVSVRVARAMADSVDRIRIQLNPIELGHIDVRMEIGPDGRFNAVFAADRPQTVEMLQRDARELARSLQDAGLRADTGSLSFNLRGEGRTGDENAWRGAPGNTPSNMNADTAGEAMPGPLVYAGASVASGRVDIRV